MLGKGVVRRLHCRQLVLAIERADPILEEFDPAVLSSLENASMRRNLLICSFLLLAGGLARGEVKPHVLFSDGAVLQ